MSNNSFYSTIVFFLLVSINLFSQVTYEEGYVISIKGDTVKGKIKYDPKKEYDLYSKVTIKTEAAEKIYKPEKVKEYVINGQKYIQKEGEEGYSFLKVITQGKINVYEFKILEENSTGKKELITEYYLNRKGSEEFLLVDEEKHGKQLSKLMKDKKDMLEALEKSNLELEESFELVKKYNASFSVIDECLPTMAPYTGNPQINNAVLEPGQKTQFTMTLYSGQSYRLKVCSDKQLGKVFFKLIDSNKKVLFNSAQHNFANTWDFNMESTTPIIVEVEAPKAAKSTSESGNLAVYLAQKLPK